MLSGGSLYVPERLRDLEPEVFSPSLLIDRLRFVGGLDGIASEGGSVRNDPSARRGSVAVELRAH